MDKWAKLPKIIRFIIIGGWNTVILYVIFAILLSILGQPAYQVCVILQWILASFPLFLNQKIFVFGTKGNYVKEYLRCCVTWGISYFLNAIILEIFVRYLIKNVFIAQLLSIFTVSIVTYLLFKFFAFKNETDE